MNLKVRYNHQESYLNFYYKYIPKANAKGQDRGKKPEAFLKKNLGREEVDKSWYKNYAF